MWLESMAKNSFQKDMHWSVRIYLFGYMKSQILIGVKSWTMFWKSSCIYERSNTRTYFFHTWLHEINIYFMKIFYVYLGVFRIEIQCFCIFNNKYKTPNTQIQSSSWPVRILQSIHSKLTPLENNYLFWNSICAPW